jgi:hypothetical protein
MNLYLYRTYHPEGTDGMLYIEDALQCYTIELPWLDNQPRVSCIPEGTYRLVRRYSARHGWHLRVKGVRGRSLILLHPANDARKELQGCIAPVTNLTGPGRGIVSRQATYALQRVVFSRPKEEMHFITIKKQKP